MRPEVMRIFDNLRQQNIISLEHAKKNNVKIVGIYCTYAPHELIQAAGALSVGLCGTSNVPIAAAEKTLPRNLCPLIKSSYGFAVSDTCPFFRFSDFIIGETTCDGKKKMFELLGQLKPMHIMHLPQGIDRVEAFQWWVKELNLLKVKLEEVLGVEISQEKIREAIKLSNRERMALRALHEINRLVPAPLTGLDMLTAMWSRGFSIEKDEGITLIKQLVDEAMDIAREGLSPFSKNTPRILLTGCPVGLGSEKVLRLLEECGGSVVCLENCSGYKALDIPVDENGNRDHMEALAEKYLKIPCSCMSPNVERFELVSRLIQEYSVDGVVDLTWQACHTYNVEAGLLRQHIRDKHQLPYLHLETDYSTSDQEQLKTRVTAFIEILARG